MVTWTETLDGHIQTMSVADFAGQCACAATTSTTVL